MNMTLMIFIIEIGVALLAALAVILFFRWKNNKLKTAGFEQLLNNIKETESERKSQLIQFLMDSHALSAEEASESGEYMLEAEKQFLEQFIKQQIEKTSIIDFYTNLCELLDQYLYFIPTVKVEPVVTDDKEEDNLESDDSGLLEVMDEVNENESLLEVADDEIDEQSEPDQGDAFKESGDEIDEAELKTID